MEKKRIVCFGDSLTWGFDPEKNQAIRNEIEYTEPRIVTKDSLMQDLNFEWADLKESLGL